MDARTPDQRQADVQSPSTEMQYPQKPYRSRFGLLLDWILVVFQIGFVVFALLAIISDKQPVTEGSREQAILAAAYYVRSRDRHPKPSLI